MDFLDSTVLTLTLGGIAIGVFGAFSTRDIVRILKQISQGFLEIGVRLEFIDDKLEDVEEKLDLLLASRP